MGRGKGTARDAGRDCVGGGDSPGDQNNAQSGQLRYVLLAGDADPLAKIDSVVRAHSVPTHKELSEGQRAMGIGAGDCHG